jgi:hypothetical protein
VSGVIAAVAGCSVCSCRVVCASDNWRGHIWQHFSAGLLICKVAYLQGCSTAGSLICNQPCTQAAAATEILRLAGLCRQLNCAALTRCNRDMHHFFGTRCVRSSSNIITGLHVPASRPATRCSICQVCNSESALITGVPEPPFFHSRLARLKVYTSYPLPRYPTLSLPVTHHHM